MNTHLRAGMALGAAAVAALLAAGGTTATATPAALAAPSAATTPAGASASHGIVQTALAQRGFRQRLAQRAAGAKAADSNPTASAGLPADGAFVRDPETGHMYRVVGRSLIYVSTWTPFGGAQKTVTLTPTMFAQVREHPVDGTFITSIQERRVYRFVGGAPIVVTTWAAFGGKPQKTIPIDYNAIVWSYRCGRSEADDKFCFVGQRPEDMSVTMDGSGTVLFTFAPRLFIKGGQDGRIYRIAGGAPIYVNSWAPYGGPKPTITVDAVAIDRAGQEVHFGHLATTPEDNTTLRDPATGHVFTVIGGAPVYVSHPSALTITDPDSDLSVRFVPGAVDRTAIDRAGRIGVPFKFLNYYPDDGVKLLATDTGNSYEVAGWRPVSTAEGTALVGQWFDTSARVAFVGQATIDRAGQAGQWSHLLPPLG